MVNFPTLHPQKTAATLLNALHRVLADLQHAALLHLPHQALHVAQAQQPAHKAARLEGLQIVEPFARSREQNRRACGRHRRQRAAALRVAVQLGENHGADGHRALKRLRLVEGRLADGGVQHEHHVVGVDVLLHLLHLLEEARFLLVPT